jgi:hypothetical protein
VPAPRLPLGPGERRLVRRLATPAAVQRWLNRLPYNWERRGETARSFRGVVQKRTAHCLEAALFAATVLEQHGYPPLLLDLESTDRLDHILFVYRRRGRWGTVARSRCPGLHGRKASFRTLDALVRSYAAPFIDQTGRIKAYGVLDLRRLEAYPWRLGAGNLRKVEQALRSQPHKRFPTPPRTYRLWKRRFDAWHEAHGRPAHAWPLHYPRRDLWLWP